MKPLILVTNDDGVNARGIRALIESMRPLGDVLVVAPDGPRSAQSSALTVTTPLRVKKLEEEDGLVVYQCNGTPADSVKLAINRIAHRRPDLVVSGINHGTNSSISVIYSGTMGAAMEGCVSDIPSIGFSLCSYDPNADFTQAMQYATKIAQKTLNQGLPRAVCLNVNIPVVPYIKGIKICRQSDGYWSEEFLRREDPSGRSYYWLTGQFINAEPVSDDTDEWALEHDFVSIVPVKVDMTAYEYLKLFSSWEEKTKVNSIEK
ncbi:MAG: 5'/3'-nucleotidase SurE [Prevotellaceae bacterium]|jgi:5'-nucleotidase|nr:5'/3'-nucleotidase SurE [Prevotellaceae bacterium]